MFARILGFVGSTKVLCWVIVALLGALLISIAAYFEQSGDLEGCTERGKAKDQVIASKDGELKANESTMKGFTNTIERQNQAVKKFEADDKKRETESTKAIADLRAKLNTAEKKADRDRTRTVLAAAPKAGETCEDGVAYVRAQLKR